MNLKDAINDRGEMICANCGSTRLRHQTVEMHVREEDAPTGTLLQMGPVRHRVQARASSSG